MLLKATPIIKFSPIKQSRNMSTNIPEKGNKGMCTVCYNTYLGRESINYKKSKQVLYLLSNLNRLYSLL